MKTKVSYSALFNIWSGGTFVTVRFTLFSRGHIIYSSIISKWCSKLWHHLLTLLVIIYERNIFIKQATGLSQRHTGKPRQAQPLSPSLASVFSGKLSQCKLCLKTYLQLSIPARSKRTGLLRFMRPCERSLRAEKRLSDENILLFKLVFFALLKLAVAYCWYD